MAFCRECGSEKPATARFCKSCGAPSSTSTHSAQQKPSPGSHSQKNPIELPDEHPDTPSVSSFQGKSKAEVVKAVIKAGAKALTKSLLISALILGPGILLLIFGQNLAGIIWLFLGSFGQIAWTYRKPWRLGLISCLVPPVAAGACYIFQLWLFGSISPPLIWVAGAAAIGAVIGIFRGRAHELYEKDGEIFAQRTVIYLAIWALAYAASQAIAMLTTNVLAIRGGLVTGALTTAMLLMVSIAILRNRKALLAGVTGVLLLISFLSPLGLASAKAEIDDAKCKAVTAIMSQMRRHFPTPNTLKGDTGLKLSVLGKICSQVVETKYDGIEFTLSVTIFDEPNTETSRWIFINRTVPAKWDDDEVVRSIGDIGAVTRYWSGPKRGALFLIQTTRGRYRVTFRGWAGTGVYVENRLRNMNAIRAFGKQALNAGLSAFQLITVPADEVEGATTANTPPGPSIPLTPPPQRTEREMTPEVIAEITAGIATLLIAAGVVVNIAQAFAAAIANALQAGVEVTAEDIQRALGEMLRGSRADHNPHDSGSSPGANSAHGAQSNAPPNVRSTERVRPPTPIYQPNGSAFETNEDGQYLAPDENGDWNWLSRQDAEQSANALQAEETQREREREGHERASQEDREDWWERQERHAAQAEQARAEREAVEQQQEERFDRVTSAALNTIRDMPPSDRSQALMEELADLHERGDRAAAAQLWSTLRGEREDMIADWENESRMAQDEARAAARAEFVAARALDISKAGLGVAAGLASGGGSLAGAALGVGLGAAVGAGEGGVRYDAAQDRVVFDAYEAARGAMRGGKGTLGAAIGSNPATGAGAAIARVVSAGALNGAEAYADRHAVSYDRARAEGKDVTQAIEQARGEAMHAGAAVTVTSLITGGADEHVAVSAAARQASLADAALLRDQFVTEAARSSGRIIDNTFSGIEGKGQDVRTAAGNALYGEALGIGARTGIGRHLQGNNAPSADVEAVRSSADVESGATRVSEADSTSPQSRQTDADPDIRFVQNPAEGEPRAGYDPAFDASYDDVYGPRSSGNAGAESTSPQPRQADADSESQPGVRSGEESVSDFLRGQPEVADLEVRGAEDFGGEDVTAFTSRLPDAEDLQIREVGEIEPSEHIEGARSAESVSRETQQVRIPVSTTGNPLGPEIVGGAEDMAVHGGISDAGRTSIIVPRNFDPITDGPDKIQVVFSPTDRHHGELITQLPTANRRELARRIQIKIYNDIKNGAVNWDGSIEP